MPKEILLYTSIYSYSAASFINEMEANKGNAINVRGNCPGGDMFGTYGMIAKFQEHPKAKEIQVDGIAASAFAYMLCFADKVTCLDASMFLYHRAAYGTMDDERKMNEGERKILDSVNAKIRSGLEAKVTNEKFLQVTGVSYDQLFSNDQRIDVILDAQQMKALGLVTDIVTLTPSKKSEIMALSDQYGIAAFSKDPVVRADTPIIESNENITVMTAAEFKAANPTAYAAILKEGADAEQSRVSALMVYNDVDPEAVAAAIKEGKSLDSVMMAEFGKKMLSKSAISALAADAPGAIVTAEETAAITAKQAEKAAFDAEWKNNLKKNKI